MFDFIDNMVVELAGTGFASSIVFLIVNLILVLILTFIIYGIVKAIESFLIKHAKTDFIKNIARYCEDRKIAGRTTTFAFFFFLMAFSFRIPRFEHLINKLSMVAMIICVMSIISAIMDVICDFYSTTEISRTKPIKGPLQIVKILLFLVLGIVAVSTLIGQDPIVLISGVGAFTAILSIVFKDALLGLVAGIFISSENMLKIGDWIKIPSKNVEGSVTDISLIAVKITAFNNTLITVPAYTFMNESFVNYHEAVSEGKRQVHRTIYIDANSVKMDGEGMTNLTKYRSAIAEKINASEHVKKNFPMQCKTGNSNDGKGLPIDIIYTTDITDYDEYCAYCSYVSDIAYAELANFDLKPYQLASRV